MLAPNGTAKIIRIVDITEFVKEQRNRLKDSYEHVTIPVEQIYIPNTELARRNIGLDL